MDNIIDVEHVSKIFMTEKGQVPAVKDFSMKVNEGEFVAIVGPSGCGKTTFLWGLTGLHNFTSGKAEILGKKIEKPRREIGIIFQQANLLPWRTLIGNINFPLEIMKEDLKKYEQE